MSENSTTAQPPEMFEGGCFCGQVRYRILGRPPAGAVCHCRSCQQAAGAESVAWTTVPIGNLEWSGEEPKIHESSPGTFRGFCPHCGSTLTYRSGAESIDITLASLDNPELLPPDREIWLDNRISWNALNPDLPHFSQWSKS